MSLGMLQDTFWDSTPDDINIWLEAQNRRILREQRERASMDYCLSRNISIMVNMGLNGKSNFPDLYDLYPSLWTEDDKLEKQDAQSVANFLNFVTQHNSNLKKDGGKNE